MLRRSWNDVFPIALAVIVLVVFAGALSGEFLDWDDDLNFVANLDFRGVGWQELRWAWTTFLVGVYQPLAWMLFEVQYVTFGLSPFGYHLTSVLLHALNAVLVYRLLGRLLLLAPASGVAAQPRRRDQLAAAAAALLWAVHPLRTEVVAWASCQPYLPCATFALLAVLAYLNAAADGARAARWRMAALALYLAALLSKAEAIMLPVALLVLDVYPLGRLELLRKSLAGGDHDRHERRRATRISGEAGGLVGGRRGTRGVMAAFGAIVRDSPNESRKSVAVVPGTARSGAGEPSSRTAARAVWLEKLPFLALAALFAVITMQARLAAQHMAPFENAGPAARVAHAAVSVWFYLGKTLDPSSLSPYYALPAALKQGVIGPVHAVAGVAAVLATALILLRARRWPALAGAWVVYLAFLLPHAGFVRISGQLGADRYTYIGSIGFAAALAAGLRILSRFAARQPTASRRRNGRLALGGAVIVPAVMLAFSSDRQTKVWQSTEELWSFTYAQEGERSGQVANNWGAVLLAKGRWAEAAEVLEEATRIAPTNAKAFHNLSGALLRLGRVDEALAAARKTVDLRPGFAQAHLQIGIILATRGDTSAAMAAEQATRLAPADPRIWAQAGQIYLRVGERRSAEDSLARARALAPDGPDVRTLQQELASRTP